MDTSAKDTTMNSTLSTSSVEKLDETKLFKLRAFRIEHKSGTTKKFVLDSIIVPKPRKTANKGKGCTAPQPSTSSGANDNTATAVQENVSKIISISHKKKNNYCERMK